MQILRSVHRKIVFLTLENKIPCLRLQKNNLTGIWRKYHNNVEASNAEELRIPVPYGFIAGKRWGNLDGYPIFCLHGLCDNADSFLPLGPLLSEKHQYIALDCAGHGLSSHVPAGAPFNIWDLVIQVKRVVTYFGLKKISILGHSMGGSTGILYGSTYPDAIEKLATLDIIKPVILPLPWHDQRINVAIHLFLDMEKKLEDSENQKGVDLEELVDRYVEATKGGITPESVKILMKRGSKLAPNGKGFVYTHDPRLVLPSIMRFDISQHRQVVRSLKCHLKIIKAAQGPLYEPIEILEEFKRYYQQQCKSFEYVEVEGTHHVHMNNPDRVAHIINDYFADLAL